MLPAQTKACRHKYRTLTAAMKTYSVAVVFRTAFHCITT